MSYYLDLFKSLNDGDVRYVVVGGVAVVLHGVVRNTADVDLIVQLDPENIEKFNQCMVTLGYQPRLPIDPKQLSIVSVRKDWLESRNMQVFSFFHSKDQYKIVDVFVDEPIAFKNLYQDKINVPVQDIMVPLASLEHLKYLKRLAGRPRDLADIDSLNNMENFNA